MALLGTRKKEGLTRPGQFSCCPILLPWSIAVCDPMTMAKLRGGKAGPRDQDGLEDICARRHHICMHFVSLDHTPLSLAMYNTPKNTAQATTHGNAPGGETRLSMRPCRLFWTSLILSPKRFLTFLFSHHRCTLSSGRQVPTRSAHSHHPNASAGLWLSWSLLSPCICFFTFSRSYWLSCLSLGSPDWVKVPERVFAEEPGLPSQICPGVSVLWRASPAMWLPCERCLSLGRGTMAGPRLDRA